MQVDNAKDLDDKIPMYNLTEYSDIYSNASASLWQSYRDKQNTTLAYSESFKSKVKTTGSSPNNGNTKGVKIEVPLKYLSRALKTPLNNYEINLIVTWSTGCVISSASGPKKFVINNTKLYLTVVTLSAQKMQNYYNI